MKKGLLILLIALLAVSAFAVDYSAKVVLHASYGDEGFSFTGSQGIWEALMSYSVSGDLAGTTLKFNLLQPGFANGDYDISIWYEPIDDQSKIEFGATGSYNLDSSDILYYATAELKAEDTVPTNKIYSKYTDFYLELGAAYKPSEGFIYLADNFNIGNRSGKSFLHTDTLAKLDVNGKNVSLNYVLSELTGVYSNTDGVSSYSKHWEIGGDFNFDAGYGEYILTEPVAGWTLVDNGTGLGTNNHLAAGVRYKYYTEESKADQNGLYAYGNFAYSTGTDFTLKYVLDAEVGKGGARVWLRDTYTKDALAVQNYAVFNFDWSGDKFQARLSETNNKFSYALNAVGVYTEFKYLNKPENAARDNGWYVKPGVTGSVGAMGYDTNFRFGFDGDKNFHWNVGTRNSHEF